MNRSLDETNLNEKVTILKINGNSSLKRRLLDLGFLPKTEIECVLISPFKDPKAYKINGNIIAIRNVDAKNVLLEMGSQK